MKKLGISILASFCFLPIASAQGVSSEQYVGQVEQIIYSEDVPGSEVEGGYTYQELLVNIKELSEPVTIVSDSRININVPLYNEGDVLVIDESNDTGTAYYYIVDYYRTGPLYVLFALFLIVSFVVARKKAVRSLLSMVLSFLVIFGGLLPLLATGASPLLSALGAMIIIIPMSFYVAHGWNRKTHVAVAGTLATMVCTGLLAVLFLDIAHITGFASEEMTFLSLQMGESVLNAQGLVLAGILISVLGVLDDITMAQASFVWKLKETAPNLKFMELYHKGMDVGRDHIGSLINTMILVYAGASLPLLMLFQKGQLPFDIALSSEIVASEVIQILIGSIGLIAAVPLTNFLGCMVLYRAVKK